MEVLVAQSYSKNLGLYAERVGAINVISSSPESATRYCKLRMPYAVLSHI
jgi:aspartate aminotransferase